MAVREMLFGNALTPLAVVVALSLPRRRGYV
jgi:hypothetical protein